MSTWVTIVAAGLLTFAIRLSFIFLMGRLKTPAWFLWALRYVPIAVLSAIIMPETVTYAGVRNLTPANPQIWAAAVSVLVAWRVKNVFVIIGAGMLTFILLRVLFGAP